MVTIEPSPGPGSAPRPGEPEPSADAVTGRDPAAAMDRMYRYTRHVYDLSRKFYLLGRDRLLREIDVRPGDRIVEVGCGTARNLIRLAQRPQVRDDTSVRLYGVDASEQMLVTARQHVQRAGLADRISLRQGLAEDLSPAMFEPDRDAPAALDPAVGAFNRFDVVFFSYSLSMIPTWRRAVDAAMAHSASDRPIYVVDFWDQGGWPAAFRGLLKWWLSCFHVEHRPELIEYMRSVAPDHGRHLQLDSVSGRYAYIARLMPGDPPPNPSP